LRGADACNARRSCHIRKRTVAVVGKNEAGVAVYAAHVQVEIAVSIHIGKHRAAMAVIFGRGFRKLQAGCCGDIGESIVTVITVEKVRSDVSANDEQVDVTVGIEVTRGRAARDKRDEADIAGVFGIPNRKIKS